MQHANQYGMGETPTKAGRNLNSTGEYLSAIQPITRLTPVMRHSQDLNHATYLAIKDVKTKYLEHRTVNIRILHLAKLT